MRDRSVPSAAAQVAIGLALHAGLQGCLPDLRALLVIPLLGVLLLRLVDRSLRSAGSAGRVLVGQALVHLLLTVSASCGSHPEHVGAHDHAGWFEQVLAVLGMLGAHLAAGALAATYVLRAGAAAAERTASWRRSAASLLARLVDQPPVPLPPFDAIAPSCVPTATAGRLHRNGHGLRAPPRRALVSLSS